MAEHSRKSFKDSLSDIKQRMREKRTQKWSKLGKTTQFSTVKAKRASKTLKYLKNCNLFVFFSIPSETLAVLLQQTTPPK